MRGRNIEKKNASGEALFWLSPRAPLADLIEVDELAGLIEAGFNLLALDMFKCGNDCLAGEYRIDIGAAGGSQPDFEWVEPLLVEVIDDFKHSV